MLDVLAEIVSAVANALLGTWWGEQSRLTQTLIWILLITILIAILYFLFPTVLGFTQTR